MEPAEPKPTLEDLIELRRLGKLSRRRQGEADTGNLEHEFLSFSSKLPTPALTVHVPKLYSLAGDEQQHFVEACNRFGVTGTATPPAAKAIDVSGATDLLFPYSLVILVSDRQLTADHLYSGRSYLNPLLEQVYTKGHELLRSFTVHEALVGRVAAKRGELDLSEAHLFPEKFKPGPYELHVELDTPHQTVRRFRTLADALNSANGNPKAFLLNPEKLSEVTKLSIGLRERLGSLSRYSAGLPAFTCQTNSCLVRAEEAEIFYLYSPLHNKNVAVYFGSNLFNPANKPADLIVLDGSSHQSALVKLVELGIFQLSQHVLMQRVDDLAKVYEQALRNASTPLAGLFPDFKGLMNQLKAAEDYLKRVVNPDARRAYAGRVAAEALEFMLYPTSGDPVVHELLPRLSWNKALRDYHNTKAFVKAFVESDNERRTGILKGVTASVLFNNQQNNNVNLWLYQQHRDFCRAAGITFVTQS